jgi:hypothetical protein
LPLVVLWLGAALSFQATLIKGSSNTLCIEPIRCAGKAKLRFSQFALWIPLSDM